MSNAGGAAAVSLCKASTRITECVDLASRSINERMGRFTGRVREVGHSIDKADGACATVRFRLSQVHRVPLGDFGVAYPTGKAGGYPEQWSMAAWARMPHRLADTEVVPMHRNRAAEGDQPRWVPAGPPEAADWARDAVGGMIYVIAPGDAVTGFQVRANTGTKKSPQWQIVTVDGTTLGKMLIADEHFRAASRALAGRPINLLSGGGREPWEGHAEQVAAVLHRAGLPHDIYASSADEFVIVDPKESAAAIGVEVPAGRVPGGRQTAGLHTVFRAPANLPPL